MIDPGATILPSRWRAIGSGHDLPIATFSQTVDVVGQTAIISSDGTLSKTEMLESKELEQYTSGGGFQAARRSSRRTYKTRCGASASRS